MDTTPPSHPAKYTDVLLPFFAELLKMYEKVLDPFAGTGKLRQVRPDAYLLEIEPKWAAISGATVGDATRLLDYWPKNFFDAVATSPCYGNRMSDHFEDHQPEKKYVRNTYRHSLSEPLQPNNAGQVQWGEEYRVFHSWVWLQCRHVLRPGGRFILNISDHIRGGFIMPVSEWHRDVLIRLGFRYHGNLSKKIETPRQRRGANGHLRVEYENIFVFTNRK